MRLKTDKKFNRYPAYQIYIHDYSKFKTEILGKNKLYAWETGSHMPCQVSSDVHERINQLPTVPRRSGANLQPSEQSRIVQWEKKTPWSFTTE